MDDAAIGLCTSYDGVQTYTAGEDGSRLAAAAKELGLQQSRRPRRPVRQPQRSRHVRRWNDPASVFHLLLETGTADARMRAIYSLHTVERLSIMTPDDAAPQEPW